MTANLAVVTTEATSPEPLPAHLFMTPFRPRSSTIVEGLFTQLSSSGAPLLMGLYGNDGNGNAWLGVTLESPISWMRGQLEKRALELAHLQRLAVDHRIATGAELYDAVIDGEDPPDFKVYVGGSLVGWELTAFTVPKRRQAQALFFEVTRRLGTQQRHRIGHLTGYYVSMWFGSADDMAGLPFKASDDAAYDRLVEAVAAHHPDPLQYRYPAGQMPAKVANFGPVHTPDDVQFMSIPLLGGVPASWMYSMSGMSTGLAFQSDHLVADEWARLRKMVEKKDKPCNDRLLISVGAPDLFGRCFLSEEAVVRFMLKDPEPVRAEHLSSVIVHFWSTGQAFEMLGPQPAELWPGIYQGFVPAHHPWVVAT